MIRSVYNNVHMFCLTFFVSFLLQKPAKSRLICVFPPLTSSILVTEVREAPHVAEADDGAGHRQDELYLVAPLAPLLHLLLRRGLGLKGAIGEAFGSVSLTGQKGRKRRKAVKRE